MKSDAYVVETAEIDDGGVATGMSMGRDGMVRLEPVTGVVLAWRFSDKGCEL